MDSATKQMLDTVDKRIAKLQQFRQTLLEEFGEQSSNGPKTPARNTRKGKPQTIASENGASRKSQIYDWLKKNGPAFRIDIIEGTGFPGGTVGAYLSTEKELFENHDGKWAAK